MTYRDPAPIAPEPAAPDAAFPTRQAIAWTVLLVAQVSIIVGFAYGIAARNADALALPGGLLLAEALTAVFWAVHEVFISSRANR